jgi:hypothetical protein
METENKILNIEEIKTILSNINFAEHSCVDMDWDFEVGIAPSPDKEEGALLLMRTSFMRKDIDDGSFRKGWGRWHTTPFSTATEKSIIMTAWVCVKMIIEHELLEGFEYHDKKVFHPHKSLEALVYPDILPNR